MMHLVYLVGGFVLLVAGGEWLVRGSVSLARAMGVSTLLISLTVVAFGTSAPELAVNVIAALNDNPGINFGNIIGSNIANVGLILGVAALLAPIQVHKSVILREIPIMLIATFATLALAMDSVWLDSQTNRLQRHDGVALLGAFAGFMVYTLLVARRQRQNGDAFADDVEAEVLAKTPGTGKAVLLTVLGLAGVIIGGDLVVRGAVGIALGLGVGEEIVGLTIVAIGTSLPELVTCLIAVRHGHTDLAIGNIVGSNIWNLLLILGVSVVIGPFALPPGGAMDVMVMLGLSIVLLPITVSQRQVGRLEGGALFVLYLGYMSYRTAEALGKV